MNNKTLYTNLEYGLWDVTFEAVEGKIQICFHDKNGNRLQKTTPLINSDTYSNFKVNNDFTVSYDEDGYFDISYTLLNTGNNSSSQLIQAVVRVIND